MKRLMDSSIAMAFVLIALVTVLVGNQIIGSHKVAELSSEQKIAHGIYDPDTVVYATEGYESEIVNGRFLEATSPGFEYLAYLTEGYAKDPSRVACERVLPKLVEVRGLLETADGLTIEQHGYLDRINAAATKAAKRDTAARVPCMPAGESFQRT